MERKEPTLSTGPSNSDEPRRSNAGYDEPRRGSTSYAPAPSSGAGPLPAIALVISLAGVAAAGFLGWKFMEAQEMLIKDAARITQLESQLNLTSSESTQSVTALGINLQKLDGEVKKLWEVSRKSTSDYTDKISGVNKSLENAKAEINNLKTDAASTKQDVLAHKATLDELPPRIEATEKAIAEQKKRVQDVASSVNAMLNQVKSAEGLAARITSAEEAIDAIDDNRRTINRDLSQIKQQLGIKNP
jgi:chromosome segregation ATPase